MEIRVDALDGPPVHADLWPVLAATAQPSLRLTRTERCDPAAPQTRLGGHPLLPPGTAWPRSTTGEPLRLVGLWNTNEINAWYQERLLAPGQLLSFFYDAVEQRGWGYDPAHREFWRVIPAAVTDAVALAAPRVRRASRPGR